MESIGGKSIWGPLIKSRIFRAFSRYPFWGLLRAHPRAYGWGLASLIFVDAINVALPLVVRMAIDALPGKDLRGLWIAGGLYFGLMAAQAVGRYAWRVFLIGTSHKIARSLRLDLYRHLQKLPLNYYQRVRTGDLMSRATNDIESIRMAVGPGVLVTVDAILMFVLIVPLMIWLSPKLALLAFAFYPLVPWLTMKLGNRIDVLYEQLQVKMSNMGAFIQESFAAIRLIKSLVLESRVQNRFLALSEGYRLEGVQQARYQAGFTPLLGFLTNLGTFLILLLGGWDVMEGAITVGTFIAFQRFVVQLSWPMEAIGWAVTMNREGIAANRRLKEIMQSPQVESVRVPTPPVEAAAPLLEIRDLKYRYVEEGHFRLSLKDLKIERGKKVGLVGPVGSGKTTLFNLLLRLYEPAAGSVFLDGRDIASVPLAELRQQIASVEQQIFLFSERIDTNIAMGRARSVKPEEILAAARTAVIHEEVAELERGFETSLGERGVNLSGGQKQRIALARALARRPRLLLLDDCFSAVDVAVEARIIDTFLSAHSDLAVCFASHRLSIMRRMDEVWLLSEGSIVDKGHHDVLMRRSPLYQSLWEKSERATVAEQLDVVEVGEQL